MEEVTLAANTWTDLTAQVAALGSNNLIVLTDKTDVNIGLKATAPVSGPAVTRGVGTQVILKQGDTLKLWARSVSGGKVKLFNAGARNVVIDATGTT